MSSNLAVPETMVSLEEAQRMFKGTLQTEMRRPEFMQAIAGAMIAEISRNPAMRGMLLQALAESGIRPCSGACSTSTSTEPGNCTVDTRLSYSRIVNLMRQDSDEFNFADNMPLQPGQAVEYQIPPFPLGRVIECFYFRPKMADGGNPDDILVEIKGDDGVLWKKFRGGRHNSQGCCLLECFSDDCIGWNEGFRVELSHTGPQGAPPLVSAAADWNYLYPGTRSKILPNWCWPKGKCAKSC